MSEDVSFVASGHRMILTKGQPMGQHSRQTLSYDGVCLRVRPTRTKTTVKAEQTDCSLIRLIPTLTQVEVSVDP